MISVTPSQLKRLGRARQIDYMRHWFSRHYEDPSNETPHSSEDGGFQYIWGGPYDAREELYNEFGALISEERIEEVVKYVERHGTVDWAPGTAHADHQRARDEWNEEHKDDEDASPLLSVTRMLESGVAPTFGGQGELAQRQAIIARLDDLENALASLKPTHGGLGHNKPPGDDPSQDGIIGEAREAGAEIRKELAKDVPNALAVARATSRLHLALGWFLKKADVAVDSFAKGLGDTGGKAVAVALGVYVFKETLPTVAQSLSDIVSMTTTWLQGVTFPF